MLCVECGKEQPRLIGGSCAACFVARTPLVDVPAVVDVELCAHCDARHVGNGWVDPEESATLEEIRTDAARGAVKVHIEVQNVIVDLVETPQDDKHFAFQVRLDGDVDGVAVHDDRNLVVRQKRAVCDRCSRLVGGFYAAVIQLRATERDLTEREVRRTDRIMGDELDRMRATGNRDAFLSKQEDVPGGQDYYMGDIESGRVIARLISQRLNGSLQETAKLVGRQEGNDVYRVTFLVRIDRFANGDFAKIGERIVQVKTIDRGRAHVIDLSDHRTDKVPEETLIRIGGPEVLREAIVVSEDAGHWQVMDPVTYKTVDLPKPAPENWSEGPATPNPFWVLREEEHLYVPNFLPAGFPPPPPKPKVTRRMLRRRTAMPK